MQNDPELSELWPEIRERGSAALRPNLARRVMDRIAHKDDLTPRIAFTVTLCTAIACMALTLAIDLWTAHRESDKALAQWNAFSMDDSNGDQDT